MFSKLLIANRGEIACRIMRTAKRMGIGTVAVYSDVDAHAAHVAMADEAVLIGPPAANLSYLNIDAILDAAKRTDADAIHPGYGFLSENPDFAEAVTAANLTFVGPTTSAIRAMGLKDAAKRLMQSAGVPVVPGYHGEDQSPALLAREADKTGYPVLIKARAGGGGKGMRRVDDPARFAELLAAARREAKAAFGDEQMLIEKYVSSPRHIEVQIFGDTQGNVVHLFERDCSLQRRHQKVIEEAPAPGMPTAVREAMTRAAVRAAHAINYIGAGTIEFIVDGSQELSPDGFWFMEMNTRLQVEHAVTEAVTGTDLVEWQLRVAAGEPLPLSQEAIRLSGHAIEARLYAEDPTHGFLPQSGRVDYLGFGATPGVRIDQGVRSGDFVSPFYDPLIAKIIAAGPVRAAALASLAEALDETFVSGLGTNRDLLRGLCRHGGFVAGRVDTGLIDRELSLLVRRGMPSDDIVLLAVLLAYDVDFQGPFSGFRVWGNASHPVRLSWNGEILHRRLHVRGGGAASLEGEDGSVHFDKIWVDRQAGRASALISRAGREVKFGAEIHLVRDERKVRVALLERGELWEFERADPLVVSETGGCSSGEVTAPMTGTVQIVYVTAGDAVQTGTPLAVMEAMKMEHTLTAPHDGLVQSVLCMPGGQVDHGAVLFRLERFGQVE